LSEHRIQATWLAVAIAAGLLLAWSGVNDWRPFSSSPATPVPPSASSGAVGSTARPPQTSQQNPEENGGGARVTQLGIPGGIRSINSDSATVGAGGDLFYDGQNLEPQEPYSLNITSATMGRSACIQAISQSPSQGPVSPLHEGLSFCMDTSGGGVALFRVTQPPDFSENMKMTEYYWPS
jgi:hypothetical protein